MHLTRGRPWLLPGIALLACTGVWLGHTIEYVRVWGAAGLEQEIAGSAHLYMLPLGLALTLLLAGVAAAVLHFRRRLSRRSEGALGLLARAWRAGATPPRGRPTMSGQGQLSRGRLLVLLGGGLAVLQIALYLIQENLESGAAGLPLPGLSAVTGVHWAAALIQAGVGVALASIAVAVATVLRRHEVDVERVERAVRGVLVALAARRCRPLLPTVPPARIDGAPALLGASLWCRPPPVLVP